MISLNDYFWFRTDESAHNENILLIKYFFVHSWWTNQLYRNNGNLIASLVGKINKKPDQCGRIFVPHWCKKHCAKMLRFNNLTKKNNSGIPSSMGWEFYSGHINIVLSVTNSERRVNDRITAETNVNPRPDVLVPVRLLSGHKTRQNPLALSYRLGEDTRPVSLGRK